MSAPIYTTAGQASAAASAAVPAGKVEAGTLIPVGEIDGAATHIVFVAGQRRIVFFTTGWSSCSAWNPLRRARGQTSRVLAPLVRPSWHRLCLQRPAVRRRHVRCLAKRGGSRRSSSSAGASRQGRRRPRPQRPEAWRRHLRCLTAGGGGGRLRNAPLKLAHLPMPPHI